MYLYVYIFLLMSVIGFYTQIFAIRVANMNANQTAIAEVMVLWHSEAYQAAKTNLTTLFPGGSPNVCAVGKDDAPHASSTINCVNTVGALPAGLTTDMKFNSIVYTVSGNSYLVTYVQNDANGFAKSGFSQTEIYRQMKKAKFIDISYGHTIGGTCNGNAGPWFITKAITATGQPMCFASGLGAVRYVPDNVVGLISVL